MKVFIEEDKKYSNVIKAHQSQLGAIELNYTGNKLATASEKGNVVRIFNTFSGFLLLFQALSFRSCGEEMNMPLFIPSILSPKAGLLLFHLIAQKFIFSKSICSMMK